MEIVDNAERHRFEASIVEQVAVAVYRLSGDTITFTHTEVPEALRGQGIGEALARAALDSARAKNLKVVVRCPFISAFIRVHPEYQDLLAQPLPETRS